MKKIITLLLLISLGFVNAQAYKGKGDIKAQVGANIQEDATGIQASTDFGIGENMSYGFTANYLLSVQDNLIVDNKTTSTDFLDRFDLKARFSANIGNVLKLNPKMDIYPGLNLGLRNFGAHLGFRYFFTDGFGLYSEAGFPISKYDTNSSNLFRDYNNQFTLNMGISFNL
jgi:outer membrane protein G